MANEEHLKLANAGTATWNEWVRTREVPLWQDLRPDLSDANLSGLVLCEADLHAVNFMRADLAGADLSLADLSGALFMDANLSRADLNSTDLSFADFSGAILTNANFGGANISEANLTGAILNSAEVGWTVFANTDLSTIKGLETVIQGPVNNWH